MSTPTTTPHYLKPLSELIQETRDRLKAGTVHEARIAHDDWCQIWKGKACNCSPSIELIEVHGHGGN